MDDCSRYCQLMGERGRREGERERERERGLRTNAAAYNSASSDGLGGE